MTFESLNESIISLAGNRGIDPRPALSASEAALSLRRKVTESDKVIWPVEQGGLAWEAVDKGRRTRGDGGTARIFCVTFDGFAATPELWKRIDEAVSTQGRNVRRILLAALPRTPGESGHRYPVFITRILERFFPLVRENESGFFSNDDTGVINFHHVASWPKTDIKPRSFQWELPFSCGSWTGEKPIYLDQKLEINERFLAARCLAAANLVPIMAVTGDEAVHAAYLVGQSAIPRMIFLSENHSPGAAILQAVTSSPILTPANDTDLAGGINWALEHQKSILMVQPGTAALSPRTVLKSDWQTGTGIIVKENVAGNAGKVLFIAAGHMAKEAVRAADRLIKIGFSVRVFSMRFICPVENDVLSAMAADYDLVIIVDTPGEGKGLGWTVGLPLLENRSINAVIAASETDGKSLAELASKIHRENRFRRTVDDVKQDRW
ncbi:MAG: transketolase C-terminal domain-containing protein [Spirochaetaceae bacterium]|nr:transketolase C-terminal domain-containing protein [Spirochaetaceae bacterium]MDT8297623.1 transketolase C-terminal domain-containing protein [Spirochaetaceae bacterium]